MNVPLIQAATSAHLQELMRRNVADPAGTGKRADVPGYLVGGKTGTAEIPGPGGYREKAVISSFLAAFPMNQPKYLVFVLLFEPKPTAAAPRRGACRSQCGAHGRPSHRAVSARFSVCCRPTRRRIAPGVAFDATSPAKYEARVTQP